MKTPENIVKDCVDVLQQCGSSLEKIAATCCMPERSPNMKKSHTLINNMITLIQKITSDSENTDKIQKNIGELGSQLGFLYATCCTSSRESNYQFLFKQLMVLNNNMWTLKGHSH